MPRGHNVRERSALISLQLHQCNADANCKFFKTHDFAHLTVAISSQIYEVHENLASWEN